MSNDNTARPAILGGPGLIEPGTFPVTPVKGQMEIDNVVAWLQGARVWEADAQTGGLPLVRDARIWDVNLAAFGWEVAAFAAEFQQMHAPGQDVFTVPCDNGTRAITIGLTALAARAEELGLRPHFAGAEVITVAATWQATAAAPLERNLASVLVDVNERDMCIDIDQVRERINDRTVAVIVVHLYDNLVDIAPLEALLKDTGIALIEDCAHAHGARYADGRAAGTAGVFSTFSFQGSKTLSLGEGGALMTAHKGLAAQIASVCTCGRPLEGSHEFQAGNDRMPAVVAALGRAQVRRFLAQKAQQLETYAGLDAVAERIDGITAFPPAAHVGIRPTYKWPFRVDLSQFGGMTLEQLGTALSKELGDCEFATMYEPLTDSPVYRPLSDSARIFSDEFRRAIDPASYSAPVADALFRSVLCAEHGAGLVSGFPELFEQALRLIRANAEEIARTA